MSFVILSTHQKLTQYMSHILTHYFPTQAQQSTNKNLKISTKYYQVIVSLANYSKLEQIDEKVDFLLILLQNNEKIQDFKHFIDNEITKISTSSTIVCVHSEDQNEEWVHQNDIVECDNFVEIVHDNVVKVAEELPAWKQLGLLDQQNEQPQLFSIFELMQTTQWSEMMKKEPENKLMEEKQEKKFNQTKQQEQEVNQEQLQAEMAEFQSLIHQMMTLKNTPVSDENRKTQAQNLIMKITKNIDL